MKRHNPFHAKPTKFSGPLAGGTAKYPGFHTGASSEIVAAYAQMKGVEDVIEDDATINDYPVVVELDMAGLKAVPDYDAIEMALDPLVSYAKQAVENNEDSPFDELQSMAEDGGQDEHPPVSGVVDALFTIECSSVFNPIYSLRDIAQDQPDPDEFIRQIAAEGVPHDVLMNVVGQYRYLDDVDEDRIVAVHYMTPFWNSIFDYQGEDYDEERVENLQEYGWDTIDLEDVYNESIRPSLTIVYQREKAPNARIEFHGTSYKNLIAAAPKLAKVLPVPPAPYEDEAAPRDNPARRHNPTTTLSDLADRIQASGILSRFRAKEVLVWTEKRDRPVIALRGDALSMEISLFTETMIPNRRYELDIAVQRAMGLDAKAGAGHGVESEIGQRLSEDTADLSEVIALVGEAAAHVLGVDDVRVTLMPMEGTPWVPGSEETRWYNAKTHKWTTSGKPKNVSLTEITEDGDQVKKWSMDFSVVAKKLCFPPGDESFVAGRVGDQTFLVSHSMGISSRDRGVSIQARIDNINRTGGILFPSLAVAQFPASNFGPVSFIVEPSMILSSLRPYKGKGRWPVVTYSSDAWTETMTTFTGYAAVTLFEQMTGNWHIGVYGSKHFYVLGPDVEDSNKELSVGSKALLVSDTKKLRTLLTKRSKIYTREMTQERLDASRDRMETRYPYLETKANGILTLECYPAVVAPKQYAKILGTLLDGIGYKGKRILMPVDKDVLPMLESGEPMACYDYAWAVRDAVLKAGNVLEVREA